MKFYFKRFNIAFYRILIMRKYTIISFFILLYFDFFAQESIKKINYYCITGISIDPLKGEGFQRWRDGFDLRSSPLLGIGVNLPKHKISIEGFGYQTITLYAFPKNNEINAIWKYKKLNIYYELNKHWKIGVGHLWRKHDNFFTQNGIGNGKEKSLLCNISYQLGNVRIEYSKAAMYRPFFSLLDYPENSFTLFYHFKNQTSINKTSNSNIKVNALIGEKTFIVNLKPMLSEQYPKIANAFNLGIEFLHKPTNISFNFERDWWLSLNGDSPIRNVKAYVRNTNIGLKYHLRYQDEKKIKVGIGYSATSDSDLLSDARKDLFDGKISPWRYFNNVKGISCSIAFPITKKFDLEAKNIFSIVGDKTINIRRFSLGLSYRLNLTE